MNERKIDLAELKQRSANGRQSLWQSLRTAVWCNHDQPRVLSSLATTVMLTGKSPQKCWRTCLHMMQGTPYIYQGENCHDQCSIPSRRIPDMRALTLYQIYRSGQIAPDDMMRYLCYKSRDNARTPCSGTASPVPDSRRERPGSVESQLYPGSTQKNRVRREDSCLSYYQKLIKLGKPMRSSYTAPMSSCCGRSGSLCLHTEAESGKAPGRL